MNSELYSLCLLLKPILIDGASANACKYLATKAAFNACERSILTHGGVGYAKVRIHRCTSPAADADIFLQEYHVERSVAIIPPLQFSKWPTDSCARYLREIFSARIAPISDQLIMCYIAERVLGQKKSY